MPRVSIILPTRDRPRELAEALDSIAAQSFRDFEVVLVNDGSSEVLDMVPAFSGDFPVKSVIPEERGRGPSAARNAGIEAASGELLAYLDDDDAYFPDHLETLAGRIDQGFEAAYSDARLSYFEREDGERRVVEEKVVFSRDFDPGALLVYNYMTMQCLMHRRSCLDMAGTFDEGLGSLVDWDLFIRLAQYCSFAHVPKATVAYMKERDPASRASVQAASPVRNLLNQMAIYERYAAVAREYRGVFREQARYLARRLRGLAESLAEAGEKDLSLELRDEAAVLEAVSEEKGLRAAMRRIAGRLDRPELKS
jgi:glycosyltransferase involved in cell wall biosynthesis